MRSDWWKWLFTWEGRVSRRQYFAAGTILVAIKYAIDWSVAARFGESWRIWNYFYPARDVSLFGLGTRQPALYGVLWTIAIPFFWIGIALTLKRLQDAGRPPWWIFLFFVPVANLMLFLCMSVAPSVPAVAANGDATDDRSRGTRRIMVGVALSIVLGVLLVALSTRFLLGYGWGLFLGVPFVAGFIPSWFLNIQKLHSQSETISVSVVATLLIGLALFGLRYEGLLCLLMAVPLAIPISIAGALVARYALRCRNLTSRPPTFAVWLAILPLTMFAERAVNLEPPVVSVTTRITIDAPASVVWKNVTAFPPLAAPDEWLFRTGIAYPTSAQIVGSRPGAVRYCRFSTGDFVEPITIWDKDRLLAFDVSAQPPAMRELSPWKITPPHLEHNYMRSKRGQFRLVALSNNRTLLEGTTWYQNYFWPQAYWRAWSDGIVHKIHLRVLRHVKEQAEAR
jgi:uncharacterized membrane protein YhaH (DUF805 family)